MNNEKVKALIEEWMHKPPGSRPLLEKAIAEQYRRSREGQWLGLQSDDLLNWLKEAIVGIPLDETKHSEIENRLASLLTEQEGRPETCVQELPLAALKSTPEHSLTTGNLPDDEEIARKVRALLDRFDTGRSAKSPE